MKIAALVLCLSFGVGTVMGQSLFETSRRSLNVSNNVEPVSLKLLVTLNEEHLTVSQYDRRLNLNVKLTYSNIGSRNILLDKRSSRVYEVLSSHRPRAASERKYEYDETYEFDMLQLLRQNIISFRPELDGFITLKPGETYSLDQDVSLQLYDGRKATLSAFHPGTHYLQLKVSTWSFVDNPKQFREMWRDKGDLQSEGITSEPLTIRVKKCW